MVRSAREQPVLTVVLGLWAAFTVAYVGFFYQFESARAIADSGLDSYLEVILLAVPSLVLLGAAVWLYESAVELDLRTKVLTWTVGVCALFVAGIYGSLLVLEAAFDPGEAWLILLLSTGFGTTIGTTIGILRARSLQAERDRNRSQTAARRIEHERRQLEHLNQYLRHEVLNEAQKIEGYTDVLVDETGSREQRQRWAEIVQESSREISEFIQSIRQILDATDHEPDLETVDVRTIAEDVAARVGRSAPETPITVTGCAQAHALGGRLLDRVFLNLMENAVEHGGEGTSIHVTVAADEEWVTVEISDDGPGIDPPTRDGIFEPADDGDHGYGLFLTNNLVELYGGRLELVETGPDGTTFAVRLAATTSPQAKRTAERPAGPA